jgi:hypothetical protein
MQPAVAAAAAAAGSAAATASCKHPAGPTLLDVAAALDTVVHMRLLSRSVTRHTLLLLYAHHTPHDPPNFGSELKLTAYSPAKLQDKNAAHASPGYRTSTANGYRNTTQITARQQAPSSRTSRELQQAVLQLTTST